MYKNWKLKKENLDNNLEEYSTVAKWCNQGGEYTIVDKGDEYVVELIPEPTDEQKAQQVRAVRNSYLADTDKYMLADYPISDELRAQYVEYRQYLRDITDTVEFPNVEVKSFDE